MIAGILESSVLHGFVGWFALMAACILFMMWGATRLSIQMIQCVLLVVLGLLNLSEYFRMEHFVGTDVDPFRPLTPEDRNALTTPDPNLYWHHLVWFVSPIILLALLACQVFMLKLLKQGKGDAS